MPKSPAKTESISSPLVRKSDESLPIPFTTETVLRFSWTQLIEFIRIADPWKRAFYENECLKGHWSKRQLQRQIESLLYERTGLSTNKKAVVERARRQEPQESIADVLRDPYILEFTGLAERRNTRRSNWSRPYSTTCNDSCWSWDAAFASRHDSSA